VLNRVINLEDCPCYGSYEGQYAAEQAEIAWEKIETACKEEKE
jgi:hypothetical protein